MDENVEYPFRSPSICHHVVYRHRGTGGLGVIVRLSRKETGNF